jgi:hypothetical protein
MEAPAQLDHDQHPKPSFLSRYLDPVESVSEVLSGLVMVLTFTLGAGLIVKEGPDATKKMLLGILGCNVTWGIIDGAMQVLSRMFDLSRKSRLLELIRNGAGGDDSVAIVARELDGEIQPLTSPSERKQLYQNIAQRLSNLPVEPIHLKRDDFYAAVVTFVLVFATSIPAVLPFMLFQDPTVALRVSNCLLLTLLFLVGFRWARLTHSDPWIFGSIVLLVGMGMVAVSMWLAA